MVSESSVNTDVKGFPVGRMQGLFLVYPRLGTLFYWLGKEQSVICKAVLYLLKTKQEVTDPRFFSA